MVNVDANNISNMVKRIQAYILRRYWKIRWYFVRKYWNLVEPYDFEYSPSGFQRCRTYAKANGIWNLLKAYYRESEEIIHGVNMYKRYGEDVLPLRRQI